MCLTNKDTPWDTGTTWDTPCLNEHAYLYALWGCGFAYDFWSAKQYLKHFFPGCKPAPTELAVIWTFDWHWGQWQWSRFHNLTSTFQAPLWISWYLAYQTCPNAWPPGRKCLLSSSQKSWMKGSISSTKVRKEAGRESNSTQIQSQLERARESSGT